MQKKSCDDNFFVVDYGCYIFMTRRVIKEKQTTLEVRCTLIKILIAYVKFDHVQTNNWVDMT